MSKLRLNQKKKRNSSERTKEQEYTRLGGALRSLGGYAGGSLGSLIGYGAQGSNAGTSLGAAISRWLGSGDYTVSSNSIVQRSMKASTNIPMMHKTNQTVTIRHREFITSVKGSTGFNVGRYFLIQPGDTITFPWLSGIASKFQQYKFKGLVFHYVPTSGTAVSGTNPSLGTVMLQTTYRVNDDQPASKAEMMNEYWACEAAPSESFCHPIECDPKENPFAIHYVRSKPAPLTDSPLMYDVGKLFVATQGQLATDNILGDLWVTYEIELSKPIINSTTTGLTASGSSIYSNPAVGNWFGPSVSALGAIPYNLNTNTITFPRGTVGDYLINVIITASSAFTAGDLSGTITRSNCTGLTAFDGNSTTYVRTVVTGASASTARLFFQTAVRLEDPSADATVTVPAGTWTGAAATSQTLVTRLQ